jgi:histidine triad (HIT) family protein
LGKVASILGVSSSGYRYLGNNGIDGGQEVPHLHFHIFGGEKLGRMIHK